MNYRSFEIVSQTNFELESEIPFCIASARAEGVEIVKITFSKDRERLFLPATKILRSLKRKGRVEFFELAAKLNSDTTEARFFRNKYTDFIHSCLSEERTLVIKL